MLSCFIIAVWDPSHPQVVTGTHTHEVAAPQSQPVPDACGPLHPAPALHVPRLVGVSSGQSVQVWWVFAVEVMETDRVGS